MKLLHTTKMFDCQDRYKCECKPNYQETISWMVVLDVITGISGSSHSSLTERPRVQTPGRSNHDRNQPQQYTEGPVYITIVLKAVIDQTIITSVRCPKFLLQLRMCASLRRHAKCQAKANLILEIYCEHHTENRFYILRSVKLFRIIPQIRHRDNLENNSKGRTGGVERCGAARCAGARTCVCECVSASARARKRLISTSDKITAAALWPGPLRSLRLQAPFSVENY
ncbi:hypothetical protein J6590_036465 [Homalodisca vitripennis]|nr:hypothetical protein J6590_036465 [Homalodisca vitripennis]